MINNIWKDNIEKVPQGMKDTNLQIQEAQCIPTWINKKKSTPS